MMRFACFFAVDSKRGTRVFSYVTESQIMLNTAFQRLHDNATHENAKIFLRFGLAFTRQRASETKTERENGRI